MLIFSKLRKYSLLASKVSTSCNKYLDMIIDLVHPEVVMIENIH